MRKSVIIMAGLALALTACGGREDRSLMNIQSMGEGPDEFAMVPNNPLAIPEDLAALPTPETGGKNRVDLDPQADAIAALGGSPALATSGASKNSERALLAAATRFGVDGNIREKLAAEDKTIRDGTFVRPMERLARVNVYNRVYEDLALDPYAELERLRRLGVKTPTAPPKGEQ